MFSAINRRDFLRYLAVGGASLPLSHKAFGQRPHAAITATKRGDNFVHISGAGGNVLLGIGPADLLLVNGGLAERSADLLKVINEHSAGKRVATVFNTDWHPDHTGLNETLGKAGAKIIAHEYTRQYLGEEMVVDWENRTYKPLPKVALPTTTFYKNAQMTFGKDEVQYGHLGQAHTDGDIYVFFPGPNILVAGDVLTVGKYPVSDYTTGGWLGGHIGATKALIDLANAETRVVTGTGPVQTRDALQAQHDMLVTLRDRFLKMIRSGMGPEDILASGATKEFDPKWGDPEVFVNNAYRGMWLHIRELGGVV
jgi:cyclase